MVFTLLRALFIALVTIPISLAAMIVLPFQPSHRFYHFSARTWSKIVLWTFGIKVTVKGTENLEAARHYIYVSNHASMFDIPAVLTRIPDRVHIVLKRELTKVPFWGWALKYGPYITIDRSNPRDAMQSIEEAAEKIRRGKSVLLFAEGTRTRDGKLQPFKRGAFTLAAKSGIPIVPVAINNTFKILPKGTWRVNPVDISLVLGKPIPTVGVERKEDEQRLMEKVHNVIEEHYVEQA